MYPLDLSLTNIWKSWYNFRQGKKASSEIDRFSYCLEKNLFNLYYELNNQKYQHGKYFSFEVHDNKRRNIEVALIRDRVVHRLLYDYLVEIFDKAFIFDVWSCRKGKGLTKAISLSCRKGIPIGNLTSQVFANIYLNELDRLVKYQIKPKAYLRYGDDFIIIENDANRLNQNRKLIIDFLNTELNLVINPKNDIIVEAKSGIKFLGVEIFPKSRRLNSSSRQNIRKKLNLSNISSYYGLVKNFENQKRKKVFQYQVLTKRLLT